jgi:type I restriction enzyme S subunit
MSKSWPRVSIGEAVSPVERSEVPIPGKYYRQIGVRLWGQGAYEREILDGGQTKYQALYRVEAGDIIVNKIWARNGSVAVVNGKLGGCFCSGEFPIYAPDRNRIEPRWFHWITKTSWFWYECDLKSRGTSGKNRIRPEKFLEIPIPLPPLEEQRRIVTRIGELATKIGEAQRLRQQLTQQLEVLSVSTLSEVFDGLLRAVPKNRLVQGSLAEVIAGQHVMAGEYNRDGEGFPYITGPADFGPKVPEIKRWTRAPKTTAMPGDVLLTVKGAGVGKINFAPNKEVAIGRQLMAIRPNPAKLFREFLFYFLKHRFVHFQSIATATTVPGFKKEDVENLEIPILSVEKQRDIVSHLEGLQTKMEEFRQLQVQTDAELNALLPSILDKAFKGEL